MQHEPFLFGGLNKEDDKLDVRIRLNSWSVLALGLARPACTQNAVLTRKNTFRRPAMVFHLKNLYQSRTYFTLLGSYLKLICMSASLVQEFELTLNVDRFIADTDQDNSGAITYDEFKQLLS